jgi:hypothetical protein
MKRTDLNTNASLALGDYREKEADHIDAELQQPGRELLRDRRVVHHDRNDGVGARLDVESRSLDRLAEEKQAALG